MLLRAIRVVPDLAITPGDVVELRFGTEGVGLAYDGDDEPSALTARGLRDIAAGLRAGDLVCVVPPPIDEILRALDEQIAAAERTPAAAGAGS